MAKCPKCDKIWHCRNEDEPYYGDEDEEYIHCTRCRCDECRMMADKDKWGEYIG